MKFLPLIAVLAGLTVPISAQAQDAQSPKDIPVKRVVMSTSGLAFFEHSAKVSGDETLSFPVRLDQVNDLLKSLLVFDPKGSLKSVRLPGQEPLEQAFRDLPFSQDQLSNPVALLNAYQGASVRVKDTGDATVGQLINIVPEVQVIDETAVTRNRVTLLTKQGLKSFILENVQSIELVDDKATAEIQSALNAVRENGQSESRRLKIDLNGKETRDISLSYVVSAPLWKTAYRLVLPNDASEKGYLQGWAIVENMTGGDWNDIKLTLTSGNPVTLQQNLYPSYYVSRPSIPVEVFGRVMPRLDTGSMRAESKEESVMGGMRHNLQKAKRFSADMPAAPMEMDAMSFADGMAASAPMASSANMAQAAQVAQSSDATAQVLFDFPGDFDLASGQTMMLPFVNRELPMETVALYQPDRHAEHPFLAVSIDNTGDSGLPPGILTLYEDGKSGIRFVGDAQLALLPKSEKRMVSYALDNRTKIDREFKNNQVKSQMNASQGILRTSVKYINETTYNIKAPAEDNRTVVIEHPRQTNFELVAPKDKTVETTKTHYRIKLPLKAGEVLKKTVTLERTGWESIRIDQLSVNQIKAYATNSGKLDPKTRKVFENLGALQQAVSNAQQNIRNLEANRQAIYNDQNRIRENIKSLSGNSSLKERYLEQLDDQEDKLEDIQEKLEDAQDTLNGSRNNLQKYIRTIKF